MRTGVWQHFAFTFDRGKASLYKDGRMLASRTGMTMPLLARIIHWLQCEWQPACGRLL
jgi:hypothetical protein